MGPSADSTARISGADTSQSTPDRENEGADDAPANSGGEAGTADPAPAPRRRGRRIVRRVVKTVAVLVVVLAFLFVGDRWAVLYAENMAAEKVQDELGLQAEPEVHIDSFPFVTQLATGNLDHVELTVPHVPAGRVSVAQVTGSVNDLEIVGSLPSSVQGVVLNRLRGDVFLDFDDLNREVGASQVQFTSGRQKNTVLARGDLPVGGKQAQLRARAQVQRTGDHGVSLSVADTRVVVPGLLTYTPGEGGGLQLAGSAADKMDEGELRQTTGQRLDPGQLMKGHTLDVLADHPALLKPTGVDPSLIRGLQKVQEPKVAKKMEFSARLPDNLPGDIRLRGISVAKDGIRAELAGRDVPLGTDSH